MAKIPTNHREPWTDAEEKQLRKEARENTPTPLIAHKHGRTEEAIRGKAQELDTSLKPTNKSPYGTGGRGRRRS
ncbi:MAG: hypothetical protein ACT4PO_01250 [Actinomycetota bacterium]